jgi:adenylate kinase family enzyme
MARHLIVVSGLPAAGKSTLTRMLATALRLPVLSLDTIKEAVVDHLGVEDPMLVRRTALEVMSRVVEQGGGDCLADIWIDPARDTVEVAARFRAIPGLSFVELVCRVPTELAVERYSGRSRHRAHLPPNDQSISRIRAAGPAIAPLGLGPAYDVDTTGEIDQPAVLGWLAAHGVRGADSGAGLYDGLS